MFLPTSSYKTFLPVRMCPLLRAAVSWMESKLSVMGVELFAR